MMHKNVEDTLEAGLSSTLSEHIELTLELYSTQYVPQLDLFWIVLGKLYASVWTYHKEFLQYADLYVYVATYFQAKGFTVPLKA